MASTDPWLARIPRVAPVPWLAPTLRRPLGWRPSPSLAPTHGRQHERRPSHGWRRSSIGACGHIARQDSSARFGASNPRSRLWAAPARLGWATDLRIPAGVALRVDALSIVCALGLMSRNRASHDLAGSTKHRTLVATIRQSCLVCYKRRHFRTSVVGCFGKSPYRCRTEASPISPGVCRSTTLDWLNLSRWVWHTKWRSP